ncbi:hypothetical protein [Kutzneria sp. CA-103260]|uniref:hypothetical protein n=1 Tax=Kutzneria sp. CA-103260 TaxID=2802641 RepID=UPI001BEEF8FE|nr:SGNH/GDSL hydrolase family protein [Kutzneria sp. CA-103260]
MTLSIGGNDAKFIDVLMQCILSVQVCQDSTLDGDTAPLSQAEPDRINNQVEPRVESVLAQIHLLAPHAKILLMGYPDFFDNGGQCLAGIGTAEAPWLNQMADLMDNAMNTAATHQQNAGVDVTFSDPRHDF